MGSHPGWIELRERSVNGRLLSRIEITVTGEDNEFAELPAELKSTNGLTDIYVIGRFANPDGQILGINWIEFL